MKKKHFASFFNQVDMKNIVECPREFIAYFNALETTCETVVCTVNQRTNISQNTTV